MNLNSITADRPSVPQASPVPNSGGESFQLAYAKVYDGRYAPGATYVAPERALPAQPEPTRSANTAHTVHAGDTLSRIARARLQSMGVAADAGALRQGIAQLAKANNIRNPDRIYTGQKLDLTALDAAYGRNQAAAVLAPVPTALRKADASFDGSERIASHHELASPVHWHDEDRMPMDVEPPASTQPAPMPVATLPFPQADAFAGIVSPATAPLPPIDPVAVRQVALYEQNAAAAPEKTAEPARALPDIVYKGVAGKVLDALPIEPSTRVALQRANTVVSSTFTARSLGALTGFGGPILTVAGLLWGIFSSRQIEAAPAADAKPVADTNPVADAKQPAQTKVADALN